MANISINPITIWYNGASVICNTLHLVSIRDNLQTDAFFYYSINYVIDDDRQEYLSGNLTCNGDDYLDWLANNFSTIWILSWACNNLNLTININL